MLTPLTLSYLIHASLLPLAFSTHQVGNVTAILHTLLPPHDSANVTKDIPIIQIIHLTSLSPLTLPVFLARSIASAFIYTLFLLASRKGGRGQEKKQREEAKEPSQEKKESNKTETSVTLTHSLPIGLTNPRTFCFGRPILLPGPHIIPRTRNFSFSIVFSLSSLLCKESSHLHNTPPMIK